MPFLGPISVALRQWPAAALAAAIAVGGALSMTLIVGLVAMISTALRGAAPEQVPLILTTDSALPLFSAAAGVASAIAAGYITAPGNRTVFLRHTIFSGALAMVLHAAVVVLLGSPLSPTATAVYIGLTLPAMAIGCYGGTAVN